MCLHMMKATVAAMSAYSMTKGKRNGEEWTSALPSTSV